MNPMNGMRPVHPGEILAEELEELGLSANAFAKTLGVPTNRITAILNGQRGVTADTALRLARYFGTGPQLWLNLQKTYELRRAELDSWENIKLTVRPRELAIRGGNGRAALHAVTRLVLGPPRSAGQSRPYDAGSSHSSQKLGMYSSSPNCTSTTQPPGRTWCIRFTTPTLPVNSGSRPSLLASSMTRTV